MKQIGTMIEKPFKYLSVVRPWGWFDLFAENKKCTVKILNLKPKQSLSLQFHHKRDQLYFLLGECTIQYSDIPIKTRICSDRFEIKKFSDKHLITELGREGDIFTFKKRYLHRAINHTKKQLRILDVAFGRNDEEDIFRVDDDYGRGDIPKAMYG